MELSQSLIIAAALTKLGFNEKLVDITSIEDKHSFDRIDEFYAVGTKANSLAKQIYTIDSLEKSVTAKLSKFLSNLDESMIKLIKSPEDTSKIVHSMLTVEDFINGKKSKDRSTKIKEFEAIEEIRNTFGINDITFINKNQDVSNMAKLSKKALAEELAKAYNVIGELVTNDKRNSDTKDI